MGIERSLSRISSKAQCLGVATALVTPHIELLGRLKEFELVYHQDYETRFEAISDITKYIELEYSEERLAKHCFAAAQNKSYARSGTRIQKGLGYKTPRQVWFDFYRQAA